MDDAALRALAAAATPGPWHVSQVDADRSVICRPDRVPLANAMYWATDDPDEQDIHNARFMAAASPDAVVALLDRIKTPRALPLTAERVDALKVAWSLAFAADAIETSLGGNVAPSGITILLEAMLREAREAMDA